MWPSLSPRANFLISRAPTWRRSWAKATADALSSAAVGAAMARAACDTHTPSKSDAALRAASGGSGEMGGSTSPASRRIRTISASAKGGEERSARARAASMAAPSAVRGSSDRASVAIPMGGAEGGVLRLLARSAACRSANEACTVPMQLACRRLMCRP
eukprot:scaffold1500_cov100-Isochrysis_galbana.AAC.5